MSAAAAPDDIVRTHAEAAGNEREPLLVIEPLLAFLAAEGLQAPDDLTATPIGDGHSNVTFALSTGVVLRRPPRGPLPPSAHDVLREARLLRALQATRVRTPAVLAECADPEVIGAPFYVMELVDGEVITTTIPEPLDSSAQRDRIASELVDALVELHAVEWRALDLEGFGRPSGYLERQLRRFGGLWEHNRTREVPEVAAVGRCLADNLPPERPAPRRAWLRSSTGRWPRSAIRWPTWGTCSRTGASAATRRAASTCRRSPNATGSPIAAASSSCTRAGPGARWSSSTGTSCSRSGSRSCSWRATTA